MNDELRDRRRCELVERVLATHDLLADAFGDDVQAETYIGLAGRIAADTAAMYVHAAAEELGIPFLRSVVIAKSKLRGVQVADAEFLEQCLKVSDFATQSASLWQLPTTPAASRRFMFFGLAALHASLAQSIAVRFGDVTVEAAAANLQAEAKAIQATIERRPTATA